MNLFDLTLRWCRIHSKPLNSPATVLTQRMLYKEGVVFGESLWNQSPTTTTHIRLLNVHRKWLSRQNQVLRFSPNKHTCSTQRSCSRSLGCWEPRAARDGIKDPSARVWLIDDPRGEGSGYTPGPTRVRTHMWSAAAPVMFLWIRRRMAYFSDCCGLCGLFFRTYQSIIENRYFFRGRDRVRRDILIF